MQLKATRTCRTHAGLRPSVLVLHTALGRRRPAACAVAYVWNRHLSRAGPTGRSRRSCAPRCRRPARESHARFSRLIASSRPAATAASFLSNVPGSGSSPHSIVFAQVPSLWTMCTNPSAIDSLPVHDSRWVSGRSLARNRGRRVFICVSLFARRCALPRDDAANPLRRLSRLQHPTYCK